MPVSRLDKIYRKILLSKFFTKGWGNAENIIKLLEFRKLVSNRDTCLNLVSKNYPVTILNEQTWKDCRIIEGKFKSPLSTYLPNIMPREVEDAYFQVVLPLEWKSTTFKPVCIHLAGTGDHYFWRRRTVMAKPLLKADIGAVILENPYYGLRKPKNQYRSSLFNVSDLFVMGGCLILESIVLLHWCESRGFGPLGVCGLSMGGHMASLAASNWPKPLVLVPCLSWSTASSVFTEGVMSEAIDWDMLQSQYFSNSLYHDTLSKLCTIIDDPFECVLSQIPKYALNPSYSAELFSRSSGKCFTPHELLTLLRGAEARIDNRATIMKLRDKEAVWFMRGMMDECTHLKNFSVPINTSLVIAVCATCDGYVPRDGCTALEDLWPGITIRYIDCGHVGAYIWYRKMFRKAVIDAFERAKDICPPPSQMEENSL